MRSIPRAARARLNVLPHDIKGGVSVSWRMIILQLGCNQCRLNAHSVDLHSMWIESWSSVDRPKRKKVICTSEFSAQNLCFSMFKFTL